MALQHKLETLGKVMPKGAVTPRVLLGSADGVLLCFGTTKPADAATGYAPGCLFIDTDGNSISTTLFTNIGTAASANFDPWSGSVTQQALVADPAACDAMTATLAGVDTGTDMTAAQAATIVADLAACKAGIDANNAAIDAIIDALIASGLMAAA
jgi:hypothetical protein